MSTSTFRKGSGQKPSDTEQSQSALKNSSENFDHEELLLLHFKLAKKTKAHLCPDWDYMAIHEGSPEFECCTCDKQTLV